MSPSQRRATYSLDALLQIAQVRLKRGKDRLQLYDTSTLVYRILNDRVKRSSYVPHFAPIATLRFRHARYSVSVNRTLLGSRLFVKRLVSPVVRHDTGLGTYTGVEGQFKLWLAHTSPLATPLDCSPRY